jgi:hypothetical protein
VLETVPIERPGSVPFLPEIRTQDKLGMMGPMPRYLLERTIGDVTREELDRIAAHATEVRIASFPQIKWEHTHVVRTDAGMKAFCVYESPDEKSVHAHAEAVGLPVERCFELETDLAP